MVERLCLCISALLAIEARQIVEGISYVGVLRPQVLFPDVQRALEEGLRFRLLALLTVEARQIIEWTSDL